MPSTGLRDKEVTVRSVADGFDPEITTGRLMLVMLSTLAEYEREPIVERVNAGIAVAGAVGRPSNNPEVTAEKLRIAARVAVPVG
jgi:DNA invertase Pin-like site-specific DNA recombinase